MWDVNTQCQVILLRRGRSDEVIPDTFINVLKSVDVYQVQALEFWVTWFFYVQTYTNNDFHQLLSFLLNSLVQFFSLLLPATVTSGLAQIASFTDLFFASLIPGAAAGLSCRWYARVACSVILWIILYVYAHTHTIKWNHDSKLTFEYCQVVHLKYIRMVFSSSSRISKVIQTPFVSSLNNCAEVLRTVCLFWCPVK